MLLTRAEVAATLRVHVITVDRYIKRGLIKATKAAKGPGAVRISEEALREYLERHVVTPVGESGREAEEPAAVDVHELRIDQRVVAAEVPELRSEPAEGLDEAE